MPRSLPQFARLLILLAACAALSGCVTSKKYKMAKGDVPPAVPLDWMAEAPDAEMKLGTVIIFKGPGSWKREARWDEYVLTFTNRSAQSLILEEAVLIDPLGEAQAPGTEPWKLEKLSYTNWEKYGKTGLKLLAGAGAVALYGAAVSASAVGAMLSGGAAAGAGAAALNIIPVVAIVDITVVAILNNKNRKLVQAEFERRRLPLPAEIPPGVTAGGSLFFPMTPSPQSLRVRGRIGDEPVEFALELKPLAGLHVRPAKS